MSLYPRGLRTTTRPFKGVELILHRRFWRWDYSAVQSRYAGYLGLQLTSVAKYSDADVELIRNCDFSYRSTVSIGRSVAFQSAPDDKIAALALPCSICRRHRSMVLQQVDLDLTKSTIEAWSICTRNWTFRSRLQVAFDRPPSAVGVTGGHSGLNPAAERMQGHWEWS